MRRAGPTTRDCQRGSARCAIGAWSTMPVMPPRIRSAAPRIWRPQRRPVERFAVQHGV